MIVAIIIRMSSDATLPQDDDQRHQARKKSLADSRPPCDVPGYEPQHFLGMGAYGEVWIALERNTSRRVAIKFYAHRGGLDWSLLSREVEKLTFLFADRYVVQLIGVGWDADPPYYIMEYLERGSLAQRLDAGPMPAAEAVDLFRDVAVGLVHAHGKGVLHCDLKPANILLDQDGKPRLADFGQSRLSHEQTPSLGTLFYMAPEQADLKAIPDAQWDVYALGALLYCMLTGEPPHRSEAKRKLLEEAEDIEQRLAQYRRAIQEGPLPTAHRRVARVDRDLAEIVDRCLAPDPADRYPTVQAVLDALRTRAVRRSRRPMMVLGAVGPALLLLIGLFFSWQGFNAAVRQSDEALSARAQESNQFAARFVARTMANELQQRYRAVEDLAASPQLRLAMAHLIDDPDMHRLREQLNDPALNDAALDPLRNEYRKSTLQGEVQTALDKSLPEAFRASVASWFVCDPRGLSLARVPRSMTLGKNFGWRSFLHGGPKDLDPSWRPEPKALFRSPHLSDVFISHATDQWIVAISMPIFEKPEGRFLGVVALTFEVGDVVRLGGGKRQFAVLVNCRPGDNNGVVLQHPVFDRLPREEKKKLLADHGKYRITPDCLPVSDDSGTTANYRDPFAEVDPRYDTDYLARMEPVELFGEETGLVMIVQDPYDDAIGSTLSELKATLTRNGLVALLVIALVVAGLWGIVFRLGAEPK
ncbi:MAG: serine/threonine protein kinase [Planctomycetes bacterium]|nr:serine/threonine protein kinase [Planctomycetota bacterium]